MSGTDPLVAVVLELAERLLDNAGIPEILTRICERCVDVFPVRGAGVVIYGDDPANAESVAASDPAITAVERRQIQVQEGPCLAAWESGQVVEEPDIAGAGQARWPKFAPYLLEHGIHSVSSFPLMHSERRIGALNLFRSEPGTLTESQLASAQTLAGAATIYVLQTDKLQASQQTIAQLQEALESRMVIEQAKGKVSQQLGVTVEDAFQLLRRHARNNNRRLHDVARDVVRDGLRLAP